MAIHFRLPGNWLRSISQRLTVGQYQLFHQSVALGLAPVVPYGRDLVSQTFHPFFLAKAAI